jgi:hypothetical protein
MEIEDAYNILKISPQTSNKQLKNVFYYISAMYKPEKGASSDAYNLFKMAYKTIVEYRKKQEPTTSSTPVAPKDFSRLKDKKIRQQEESSLKDKYQFKPEHFTKGTTGGMTFNTGMFNEEFKKKTSGSHQDYVYGVDNTQTVKRDKDAYMKQHDEITAQKITPMFEGQRFDNDTFQKIFVNQRDMYKDDQVLSEPKPLAASGMIDCTHINNPQSSADLVMGAANYHQAYDMPYNPSQFDKSYIEEMRKQRNTEIEKALDHRQIQERMQQYHNAKNDFKYNTDKLITDRNSVLMDVKGYESAKSDELLRKQQQQIYSIQQQDMMHRNHEYDRLMELRRPIFQQQDHNMKLMDRPISINRKTSVQCRTPISPALLQPRYQEKPQDLMEQQKIIKKIRKLKKSGK